MKPPFSGHILVAGTSSRSQWCPLQRGFTAPLPHFHAVVPPTEYTVLFIFISFFFFPYQSINNLLHGENKTIPKIDHEFRKNFPKNYFSGNSSKLFSKDSLLLFFKSLTLRQKCGENFLIFIEVVVKCCNFTSVNTVFCNGCTIYSSEC